MMTTELKCPLCNRKAIYFQSHLKRKYFECTNCFSVLLDPSNHISPQKEKARYELHNNDVNDPGYQGFVSPIVNDIKLNFGARHAGMDFGCGPGPVITKLLRDEQYNIATYDPFFHNDPRLLNSKYDYIVCCEVIEHFKDPKKEFNLLKSLLNPGGVLYCFTEIIEEDIDFLQWRYKNDETHVFFYHIKALQWIQRAFGFSNLEISNRLIKFTAPPGLS